MNTSNNPKSMGAKGAAVRLRWDWPVRALK